MSLFARAIKRFRSGAGGVQPGLAVTVSALTVLPDGVRAMRPDEGLPKLPEFGIVMLKGRNAVQPVTDALAAHIEGRFHLAFNRAATSGPRALSMSRRVRAR